MTLTAADFAPIVTTLSDNLSVIIGLIVSIAAFNLVIRIVKKYTRV